MRLWLGLFLCLNGQGIGSRFRLVDIVVAVADGGSDDGITGTHDAHLTVGIHRSHVRIRGFVGHGTIARVGQCVGEGLIAYGLAHACFSKSDRAGASGDADHLAASHSDIASLRHLVIDRVSACIGIGRVGIQIIGALGLTIFHGCSLW